jgi:predicted amidohydrolase YtcJ
MEPPAPIPRLLCSVQGHRYDGSLLLCAGSGGPRCEDGRRKGYQIASHAIGEAAIERIIEALNKTASGRLHVSNTVSST